MTISNEVIVVALQAWRATPFGGDALMAALEAAAPIIRAGAGAKALEDAAEALTWVRPESACEDTEACCGSADSCDLMRPSSYAVGADWLRARAAAVRGEDAHD